MREAFSDGLSHFPGRSSQPPTRRVSGRATSEASARSGTRPLEGEQREAPSRQLPGPSGGTRLQQKSRHVDKTARALDAGVAGRAGSILTRSMSDFT